MLKSFMTFSLSSFFASLPACCSCGVEDVGIEAERDGETDGREEADADDGREGEDDGSGEEEGGGEIKEEREEEEREYDGR